MKSERIMVAGIHTGVGKSIVSAKICLQSGYNYWKPYQTGPTEEEDSSIVSKIVKPHRIDWHCHEPLLRYPEPVSPHIGFLHTTGLTEPYLVDFPLDNKLVVESAGGLMTPITNKYTFCDFAKDHQLKIVLVIRHYLGSINHSLLTLSKIESVGLELKGIVWNGEVNEHSESAILSMHSLPILGRIPWLKDLSELTNTPNLIL